MQETFCATAVRQQSGKLENSEFGPILSAKEHSTMQVVELGAVLPAAIQKPCICATCPLRKTSVNQSYNLSQQRVLTFAQQSVLSRALLLLGGAVAVAIATGIFTAPFISPTISLVAALAVMGLGFAVNSVDDGPVGYALVLGAGALLGVAGGPIVLQYLALGAQKAVINAALSTGVIFGALYLYAVTTRKDFTNLASFLGMSMLALLVVSLLNVFLIKATWLSMLVSFGVAVLSSGLILVRLSAAIHGYGVTAVSLAFGLLVDVYNLFMSLLRIFASRD